MGDPMNRRGAIPVLESRHLLLGVTGSIAAYKAVDLASKLTQTGAKVDVVLTRAAQRFVTPLSFQSVTGRRAFTDEDLWGDEAHVMHVSLAERADLLIVAPATANTIAKMAHGQADTLLTLAALGSRCPMLVAPAMDGGMFEHPATRENVAALRARGVTIVGPVEGRMASGLTGFGRMVEPGELLGHIRLVLGSRGSLAGKKVVVTAGGTQEPVDPVRVLANRSSGKQGFALAQAATDRGAKVVLVTGPVHLDTPVGSERIEAATAAEMSEHVLRAVDESHVLLMAAAVADFRAASPSTEKIKRGKGVPKLKLEPTEDILRLVTERRDATGWPKFVVGFAAETEDLVANARAKLEAKELSLVIANDITAQDAGFGVGTNRVTIIDEHGGVQELPLMTKAEVAEVVIDRVVGLLT